MKPTTFSGHIYLFYAFDIGDDIQLDMIKEDKSIIRKPLNDSKYFKNYHTPLAIELPQPLQTSNCDSVKIYNFGVVTLRYKIPFSDTLTLENLKQELIDIVYAYNERAIEDAHTIFKKIQKAIKQPQFYHLSNVYVVIQVDPTVAHYDGSELKEAFGHEIASLVRFEKARLSTHLKDEILADSFGYYKGDLLVIDTEAAFVYDADYGDLIDIFEFANIQQLELQYFDKLLDHQLNLIYNRKVGKLPISAYLPFWGTLKNDPVGELGKLKADISVIIERVSNNIKLAGETYASEVYTVLSEKLDLQKWHESLQKKLDIVHDIRSVYANKVDVIREDILSVLIIILIMIELIVAIVRIH
jgi:hypothetical protein